MLMQMQIRTLRQFEEGMMGCDAIRFGGMQRRRSGSEDESKACASMGLASCVEQIG